MAQVFLMFTILMLHVYFATGDGQNCQFGPGCKYKCNCAGTCSPQTGCVGNCTRGRDGRTCQRRNVALSQTTTQSSNYQPKYTPGLAVDGNVGHDLDSTPCTHTQIDYTSWWAVTLDGAYSLYRFQIYNRIENCGKPCGQRLNSFILSVGTDYQSYSTCYTDTTARRYGPGDIINGTCDDGIPITGNTVRISLPAGSNRALTLCEVRLFVCSEGWYGELCDKECVTDTRCSQCHDNGLWCVRCVTGRWGTDCDIDCGHCWNNTSCDKNTGQCPNSSPRCESGFQGENCTTPCTPGSHGPDCGESCGPCAQGQDSWNQRTGHCPTQTNKPTCESGSTGPDCKTNYSSYRWGPDCEEACGQCYGEVVCDRISGDCPPGNPRCATGYTGRRCTYCPGGTFGDQCQGRCGQCKDGIHTCDHVNGTCTSCADGWLGDLCKEVKAAQLDGPTREMPVAGIVGGVFGAVVLLLVVAVVVLAVRRRRRQSGQSQGTAASAVSTSVTQHVPRPEVPNRTLEPGTDPATYYNISTDEEHPYETVPEKEYDKVRFSRLDTDNNYASLT